MNQRILKLAKQLAKSSLLKEVSMNVYEVFVSVWPFLLGALLLYQFQRRLWVSFFVNLACAAVLAVVSFSLHRIRRKTIECYQEMLLPLQAEHEHLGRFLTAIVRRGSGTWVRFDFDPPSSQDLRSGNWRWQAMRPESKPEKMN